MANVSVKFNNKDYLLSCDDGQEESLKKLTKFLDKKYSELQDKLGNIGENKLLLITTIQLIDEYFDLKKKITDQAIKLSMISDKFKEIKSLAVKYKEDKDIEIVKLNKELENFRKTIEKNKTSYELMIDKTTQSLEKIISNTETLPKIQ
jgi:cell division protein ZapA